MVRAVRAGLTIAAVAILVPLAGPTSPALAAPYTQAPTVNGRGPDDLLFYNANGLNPGTPVTVTIDGVGTTSYHGQLAVQTTTAGGNVTSPATARTPADLLPGTYSLTFTQEASDAGPAVTLTTPTFTIVPPSIFPPGSYVPGATVNASLQGLGGGPSVHRTDTIDGVPVAGSPYENLGLGYLQERFVVPTTLAPGAHTLRITQDVNPAATVSTQFSVFQPTLTPSVTTTSTRGSFSVQGVEWGQDDVVDLAVIDAAGARSELTTVSVPDYPVFTATVQLPNVAPGTATVVATSERNHAVVTQQLTVLPGELGSPVILPVNGKVQSSRSLATLQMQPDGNLVLYVVGQARWSSRTNGHPGAYLAVQGDGNLVVYSPTGVVLWTAGTARQGAPVRLVVQDDGNVVLYSNTGRAVWSTGTAGNPASTLLPGQGLVAGNRLVGPGRVVLSMQSDGNAVLYGQYGSVVWSTHTAGNPGAALKFQNDGEVCVYAAGGSLLFANHPTGLGWRLVAQGDGNLVEYGQDGKAVWSSGTSGR